MREHAAYENHEITAGFARRGKNVDTASHDVSPWKRVNWIDYGVLDIPW